MRAWRQTHQKVFLPLVHPAGEAQVSGAAAELEGACRAVDRVRPSQLPDACPRGGVDGIAQQGTARTLRGRSSRANGRGGRNEDGSAARGPDGLAAAVEAGVRAEPGSAGFAPAFGVLQAVAFAPGFQDVAAVREPIKRRPGEAFAAEDFGQRGQRIWNEVQNTTRDTKVLSNHLLLLRYKELVWSRRNKESQ